MDKSLGAVQGQFLMGVVLSENVGKARKVMLNILVHVAYGIVPWT